MKLEIYSCSSDTFDSSVDLAALDLDHKNCPLEALIDYWVGFGKKLVLSTEPNTQKKNAMLFFEMDKNDSTIGSIDVSELTRIYGKHQPIVEDLYNFSDMEGKTADPEWLAARDKKYSMRWSKKYELYIISPRFLGKYILSYLYSSGCIIEISSILEEDKDYVPRYHYQIKATLIAGMEEEDTFWQESIFVPQQDMKKHIQRRLVSN